MVVKELSVKEKLVQLSKLQKIDSKLDEIKIMKGELPMEVSDLEDDIVGLTTREQKLKDTISDLDHEILQHRNNIKESEAMIVRYKQQLDNVKNNREYDALNKEVDYQNLEIQLSEKKINKSISDKAVKEESLNTISEKRVLRAKDLDAKKAELAGIIEKTEKEEEKLIKESDKARKDIELRFLKAYDKIRSSYRNGLAVVSISRESCGGCFNKIPPQIQIEIGVMKNIIACEHCGRILIDEQFVND
jgi:predicted  nucleic acid-binding Zn-ribbon protein